MPMSFVGNQHVMVASRQEFGKRSGDDGHGATVAIE